VKKSKSRILALMLVIPTLPGCLSLEDKGATEFVGTPVSGEGNFTVELPPPGPALPPPGVAKEPSQPPSEPADLPPEDPLAPEFYFKIDQDADYSDRAYLNMDVATTLPTFMSFKLSANDSCVGGQWESMGDDLKETKVVRDFAPNSLLTYSVTFRDVDGMVTPCYRDSIIHDDRGPSIVFAKYPMGTLEEGATGEISFDVRDISPITSVTCQLNSISKPCLAGANLVNLTEMPSGTYTFQVRATDIHGHTSNESISWNVVNRLRYLTQTVIVKDDRKVDILVVIDNSGSMDYEQKSMASRVRNMLSVLRGFDYRIAVTTTDPRPTFTSGGVRYYGDGDLIPIWGLNNQLWIDSSMNESVAQEALGRTIQRPETGSGSEQGIRSAYRFVEKATAPGQTLNFFRSGANFATLIISDEDESANTDKNDPIKFLELVSSRFSNQKAFSWHSIITRPGDTQCRNTYGAVYGERLAALTDLTGGILGSVCELDYATQVTGIASAIRNLVKVITLSCEPLKTSPIKVTRNGTTYTVPFTVEGVNLKFQQALDPGEYKVEHACLRQ
jgi:hypothetical protein